MPKSLAKNLDDSAGHRQRMRDKILTKGSHSLADYELLEFALFAAKPRGDTKPLAKALLKKFGGFAAVVAAPAEELLAVEGMGQASVAAIKVIAYAAERMAQEQVIDKPALSGWDKLIAYCRVKLAHKKVEEFHLLFLDKQNVVIADELQHRGTVDHTPVYPREIASRALQLGASAVIMVHNHPSGDPTPSRADIKMTREVKETLNKLSIVVHDHIIIGKSGTTSFKSQGLL